MKISLIGFMGAGKSTVAQILATRLNYSVVEMDYLIQRESGRESLLEIFEKDGEPAFRKLESEVASELSNIKNVVISTGGGIISSQSNRDSLKENGGKIIYLETDFQNIQCRLEGDTERPLFKDQEKAKALLEARAPKYSAWADITVSTNNRTPDEIASLIIESLGIPSNESRLAVIGDPVSHSRSPLMHTAGLKAAGLSGSFNYSAIRVSADGLPNIIGKMRTEGIRGFSVTIPHKIKILQYLDSIDPSAKSIGAVNTVVNDDGILTGYNTDYFGVLNPLTAITPLSGKLVTVIGAGGASRAAVFALKDVGAKVTVLNRTVERAKSLASDAGVSFGALSNHDAIRKADIIINTTSVGMVPETDVTPFPTSLISANQIVFDLVYTPQETRLLAEARARGARVISGIEMFIAQGALQFELFTGKKAPIEEMRAAVIESLQ